MCTRHAYHVCSISCDFVNAGRRSTLNSAWTAQPFVRHGPKYPIPRYPSTAGLIDTILLVALRGNIKFEQVRNLQLQYRGHRRLKNRHVSVFRQFPPYLGSI